jgi:hypothetical protein
MAKASSSLPTNAVHHNPAVAAATAELVALINSRPESPREDEIAAIVAKVLTPQGTARDAYVASEWYRILDQHLEASSRATTDKEHYALDARLSGAAKAICAGRVRTPGDLIERAAIAVHWYSDDGDLLSSPADPGEHALAAVVRGIIDLASLKFDAEGRLLD